MYAVKEHGKNKYTGIAQTGSGWRVSTYTVKGRGKNARIITHADKRTRTLAQAKKIFTLQKRKYSPKIGVTKYKPKRRARLGALYMSRPFGFGW